MASASHLVGCVALAALAYFVALAIYNVYLHPLAKMPGPKLYAISPWFQIRHKLAGRWEHVLKTLHDEYGPAVRFAPDEVSFITIDSWKAIYGHRAHGQEPLVKDTNFFFHDQGAASHIMNADIEGHRRMRRVIAHAFSEKALRGQESVIKHYVDLFINNMKAKAALGDPINIVRWFNFTTFDVIGDLSFGKSFGMLESGAYHPWIAMIFDTLGVIPFVQLISRYPVLKPIAALFTPKQQAEGRAQHLALSRETTIERIRSGGQDRQDFMSYILRNNNSDNEKSNSLTLTEDEMVENANILILAGSETTATLLSGTTFHLLSNPATYNKLVAEIRGVFTCEDDITITSTTNLEYLAAVFNETFRMYPPAPTGSPRRVPTGGMTIEGYFLPAKTSTSVHQWSAYQSAYNFYEPQSFLPERWLASVNTTDPRFVHDKRDVLQPFLTGPTLCIGKNLAYAEIRLILCRLLFSFDLELQAESKRWADQRIMALWEKGDLMVKLTAVNR